VLKGDEHGYHEAVFDVYGENSYREVMKKYCCRKFKRFDKKYGGIVLLVDNPEVGPGFKQFREIWDLKNCIFCGEEIKQ